MLCPFCTYLCQESVQRRDALDNSNPPLHSQTKLIEHIPAHTAAELEYGREHDCYMCLRFWTLASKEYRAGVEGGLLYPPENQYKTVTSFMIHLVLHRDASDGAYDRAIYIYVYHSKVAYRSYFVSKYHAEDFQQFAVLLPDDIDPYLPPKYEQYRIGDSSKVTQFKPKLEEWRDRCLQTHPSSKCSKPPKARAKFPTRLVQVGDPVKLVDTVSIDKSEPYTTLSYTWGLPGTVLKTTDDNIAAHKNSIPLSTEYKTLEDAIYVTRSMGVKYIWIDSLCIIQDQLQKPSDFDIEGQHMKEIYSNSIFTIAASRGQGTGVSCFASRTSDALIKPQRFFPAPSSNNMYSHSYYFIVDHNIWSQAVTDAALNMRGWVFQERLLAPRTMHFCDDQIFWECREFAACEAFPWGLPSKLTDQDGGFLPFEKHGFKSLIGDLAQSVSPAATASSSFWSPRPQQSLQDPDGWSITLNRWHQVVEAYTKRGLTKPADKVVAIAGIAQKFKPVLHDKFVAGLWDNLIIYELAWTVHYLPGFYPGDARPIDPQTGQKIYCGPTWSWVSLNRHVEYKLGPNIHQWVVQATNVSCVVQPGGEFDTPVERGTILCLKGRFVEMEVINMPSRGQGSNHVSYILGGELIRQNIIDLDATKIEDHLEKTLALMPLLWQKGRDPRSGDRLIGLVLQKDGYNYRRIGILEASSTLDRNVFATLAPASNPVPTTIRII